MENDDAMMKALQEEISRKMAEMNRRPVEEMDYLSPLDMHQILYDPFGEESPIGFKKITSKSVLDGIPFLNLFEAYLGVVEEAKELKLTARGNLPRTVCLDLYGRGILKEEAIESGIVKLSKEEDSVSLQNLKILGSLTGITKKRNNKISLTKKGGNLFKADKRDELLKELFTTNCRRFNLGFHDGYSQEVEIQKTFGFTLYLLLRYGKEKRDLNYYTKKSLLAFPFELDNFEERWSSQEEQYEQCFNIRIMERFLNFYGLIDYHKEMHYRSDRKIELQTTPIFDAMFELRKDKFRFMKNENYA